MLMTMAQIVRWLCLLASSVSSGKRSEGNAFERPITITLLPLDVDETPIGEAIEGIEESLPGTKCTIVRVDRNAINLSDAFVKRRGQHIADVILSKLPMPHGDSRIIGIVSVDIYSGNLNFVFGIAELPGKRAVVSTYRLQLGGVPKELFVERLIKEIVHELGHTFGLRHCDDRRCVMHFSNSISDTDYKSVNLCNGCMEKYKRAALRR